ncbi:hypothetical protein ADUPG1_009593 [Aduncisulcus paluster]|uniref:Uncharacterized protein n=1 Tax=Aduncisulcus paluster TaxID=2918883 RepID=A0ABQ5KXA9_9EUKA|nr:hypothetical protein ADUPG1_009593 [Aduncisulcus paluster]
MIHLTIRELLTLSKLKEACVALLAATGTVVVDGIQAGIFSIFNFEEESFKAISMVASSLFALAFPWLMLSMAYIGENCSYCKSSTRSFSAGMAAILSILGIGSIILEGDMEFDSRLNEMGLNVLVYSNPNFAVGLSFFLTTAIGSFLGLILVLNEGFYLTFILFFPALLAVIISFFDKFHMYSPLIRPVVAFLSNLGMLCTIIRYGRYSSADQFGGEEEDEERARKDVQVVVISLNFSFMLPSDPSTPYFGEDLCCVQPHDTDSGSDIGEDYEGEYIICISEKCLKLLRIQCELDVDLEESEEIRSSDESCWPVLPPSMCFRCSVD